MTGEGLDEFAAKGVPNVAVVVVVAGEEVAAGEGEGDRGDTGVKISGGVRHELSAGAKVEETTSGVVGTGAESVAGREELHGIDIGSVAIEGLRTRTRTDIPQLRRTIASAAHKQIFIG